MRKFGVLLEPVRVRQGSGVRPALMLMRHIERGGLVRFLPDWNSREVSVYLTCPPVTHKIARVAAVLEVAEEILSGLSAR